MPSSTAYQSRSTTPKEPVSVVHTLAGGFGRLHAGTLPEFALRGLREECWGTSCDAVHSHTTLLIDPQALDLLHQTDQGSPHDTALLKLPDGYVLFQPRRNNQILSIIKDAPLCVPEDTHPSCIEPIAPDGAKSVFYSLVPDPALPAPSQQGFRIVFHDGYTHAHEISRFCMADHAIAQVAAAIPLDLTPRVIMRADPLGALMGQCLKGADADLIKRTFLGLVAQASSNVYDTPIETSETLSRLLQLKSTKGNISLARLRDGVLGYRNREDGHRTFIFVANSDDFHADTPVTGAQSLMHVYKMQYKNPKPEGARLFVQVGGGTAQQQQPQGFNATKTQSGKRNINVIGDNNHIVLPGGLNDLGVPHIKPGEHTVQNVLGLVEMAMRYAGRQEGGCGAYPAFCADNAHKLLKQHKRNPGAVDPLALFAAQHAIAAPVREPTPFPFANVDEESSSSSEEGSSEEEDAAAGASGDAWVQQRG